MVDKNVAIDYFDQPGMVSLVLMAYKHRMATYAYNTIKIEALCIYRHFSLKKALSV